MTNFIFTDANLSQATRDAYVKSSVDFLMPFRVHTGAVERIEHAAAVKFNLNLDVTDAYIAEKLGLDFGIEAKFSKFMLNYLVANENRLIDELDEFYSAIHNSKIIVTMPKPYTEIGCYVDGAEVQRSLEDAVKIADTLSDDEFNLFCRIWGQPIAVFESEDDLIKGEYISRDNVATYRACNLMRFNRPDWALTVEEIVRSYLENNTSVYVNNELTEMYLDDLYATLSDKSDCRVWSAANLIKTVLWTVNAILNEGRCHEDPTIVSEDDI